MALSFAASEQHVQAFSLLQRAVERLDSAATKHQVRAVCAPACLQPMMTPQTLPRSPPSARKC